MNIHNNFSYNGLKSFSLLVGDNEKTFFATIDKEGKLSLNNTVFKSVKTDLGEHLKRTADNTDAAAKSIVFVTLTKTSGGGHRIEVAAHSDFADQINAHFGSGKKITIEHPSGKRVTHDIHSISLRTFTSEELQNALTQFLNSVEENRKRSQHDKENGRTPPNPIKQYPAVNSRTIKENNEKEKEGIKRIVVDHFARGIAQAVARDREKKAEAREKRSEEERDRIKETEIKRSENRNAIKKEDQAKLNARAEEKLKSG